MRHDGRIPLIPTLDNPAEYKKTRDEGLRERCRQLNTYRSIFRRPDEALCRQVDHGPATKTCLPLLQMYIAQPDFIRR